MMEIGICEEVSMQDCGAFLDPFEYLNQHAWRKMAEYSPKKSVDSLRLLRMEERLVAVYSHLDLLLSEREAELCTFEGLPFGRGQHCTSKHLRSVSLGASRRPGRFNK